MGTVERSRSIAVESGNPRIHARAVLLDFFENAVREVEGQSIKVKVDFDCERLRRILMLLPKAHMFLVHGEPTRSSSARGNRFSYWSWRAGLLTRFRWPLRCTLIASGRLAA